MKKFWLGCLSAAANMALTIVLVYVLSAIAKLMYLACKAGWRAF